MTTPYDNASLDASAISINDNKSPYSFISSIDGYSVSLEGRLIGGPASIAQTGMIPSNVKSVVFLFRGENVGSFEVSFNGHVLPLARTSVEPDFDIYGADISDFVGQTGELRFKEANYGRAIIDDIQFSSEAIVVPEPGTMALFGMGALALVSKMAFRRERRNEKA